MSRISRRDGVDDDVFDLAQYLIEQSPETARRFADAVEKTLKDLAQRPGMGSRKEFNHPELADVRSWWIEGFPNHLIYYLPLDDGIDVLAVLHGSRDTEPLLKRRL